MRKDPDEMDERGARTLAVRSDRHHSSAALGDDGFSIQGPMQAKYRGVPKLAAAGGTGLKGSHGYITDHP